MTGTLPPGWTLFGAPFEGPAGTLQRARGPQDRTGVVLQFRPDMTGHPALGDGLDPILPFLKEPGVAKVHRLIYRDPTATWFLYELDERLVLSELLHNGIHHGDLPSERAAAELVASVAEILHEACRAEPTRPVWSHRDLTPWRITIGPEGDASLIGFGLPPAESVDWLEEDTETPPGPGFRYSPPERIQGTELDEDVRSDLYCLGVIAAEVALGDDVMRGTAGEVVNLILSQYLWDRVQELSRPLRSLLWPLLHDKPEKRPSDAARVAAQARDLVSTLQGASLAEIASRPQEVVAVPQDEAWIPEHDDETDTAFDPAPHEDDIPVPMRPVPMEGPVQTQNLVPSWIHDDDLDIHEDDPSSEQEILDYESVMSQLKAVPSLPEMALLDDDAPIEVPTEPPPPTAQVHEPAPEPLVHVSPGRLVWPDAPPLLMLTSVSIDFDAQEVMRSDGTRVPLADIQAQVLAYLAGQRGREMSAEKIWHGAIQGRHGSPESIRGLVVRLREKIEERPEQPEHLIDGDSGGYRFIGGEAAAGPSPLPELEGPVEGREEEQKELFEYLEWDNTSLATVVGPPGSGASQLALAAAWHMHHKGFEVHRAAVGGNERFSTTIARGLGIRSLGRPNTEVLHDIGARLHENQNLVLFLDAPRPHAALRANVSTWLAARPAGLLIVAASSPLALPGERVIRLGPLGLERAIRLFREKVGQYRPGAEVSDDTARAIAEYLDRMPVAIEAAAAQTAFLTPEALLERLASGLQLDFGDGTTAGMDANLAEIIEQLDRVDRRALEQLSVCEGGFDLAAAEAIVRLPSAERRSMLSVLGSLEARSLVQALETEDGVGRRWAPFEIVRNYLRRNLSPEELLPMDARHARHYAALGLRLGAGPWVERAARSQLIEERGNLRTALARGGYEAAGAAIGLSAILGSEPASDLAASIEALAESLEITHDATTSALWAASRVASARVNLFLGQVKRARDALREAASELSTHDVRLLVDVAWMHTELGSTFGSESALHRVTSTDPWVLAVVGLLDGRAHFAKLDHKAAERSMVQALHGFAEIDAAVGEAHTQRHLAEVLVSRGKARRAVAQLRRARETFEAADDVTSALQCRIRAAELLVGLGQEHRAIDHLEVVISEAKAASAQGLLAFARGILAVVHGMGDRRESAEHHFYLALAHASPQHQRLQALYALHLLLTGDPDTAQHEAQSAMPDPVARAVSSILERSPPPRDSDEAYMVYDALEAWRAEAPLARIDEQLGDRASLAVRMVLAAPPPVRPEP